MTEPTDTSILQLSYRYAAIAVEIRALALFLRLKAGFRPEQPRVPAGSPDGGQWVAEGDDGRPILVSRRGPRGAGQVRILGRWQAVTPAQQARLAVSVGRCGRPCAPFRSANRTGSRRRRFMKRSKG